MVWSKVVLKNFQSKTQVVLNHKLCEAMTISVSPETDSELLAIYIAIN